MKSRRVGYDYKDVGKKEDPSFPVMQFEFV